MHCVTCILAAATWLATGATAQALPYGNHGVRAPEVDLACMIEDAQPGDTILIRGGEYRGHFRITKPLTIIGIDMPIINGGGETDPGDIFEVAADHVELRGLIISNTGDSLDRENCAVRITGDHAVIEENLIVDALFGIDVKEASDCVIRGNFVGGKDLDIARRGDGIRLFRADRALIQNNQIMDGRDAILWYSSDVRVIGNTAHHCRYGFHLMYSDRVVLEDNLLTDNSVGVYFMYSKGIVLRNNTVERNRGPSGYGVGLKETDDYTIEGNMFGANRVGVYIDGSPFTIPGPADFTGNTFACNDIGMTFLPSVKGNRVHGNSFIDNAEQVAVSGRGELEENDFDVDHRGNYWSDYGGYDADGDGVGEAEYESRRLFESLTDRRPELRLFRFGPAHRAVEFVARAVPAVRPEPKFVDWYPLVEPPRMAERAGARASESELASNSAWMLAMAGAVVSLAFAGPATRFLAPTRRGGAS